VCRDSFITPELKGARDREKQAAVMEQSREQAQNKTDRTMCTVQVGLKSVRLK
jgi:hypothetical protein